MKTRSAISKDWHGRGFSCDSWVDPPNQKWEGYVHDVDELIYMVQGQMELEVSGKKKILNPGDEAFIPAHAVHSVRNIGGTETHWLYGYKKR